VKSYANNPVSIILSSFTLLSFIILTDGHYSNDEDGFEDGDTFSAECDFTEGMLVTFSLHLICNMASCYESSWSACISHSYNTICNLFFLSECVKKEFPPLESTIEGE
jgi:hypothetical protein